MEKLLQNKISESKLSLPVMVAYALGVWLICGLATEQWWIQFGCFAVTTYLMVELNNMNALIRIYSRMVSCSFLLLSCMACFLMPNLKGAVMQMCVVASYLLLFQSYQDKLSLGKTYYAFLFLGLASLANVHILFYVPFVWLLMGTNLLSLSWRTWGASLLGLLTPYWFGCCWLIYQEDFSPLVEHFTALGVFGLPISHTWPAASLTAVFALLIALMLMSIAHYLHESYHDKIRIRMLYGFIIWMDLLSVVFMVLQPQHYDMLLRMLIINTSPLIAHFLALTSSKVTNAIFCVITAAILFITAYNVWTFLSLS